MLNGISKGQFKGHEDIEHIIYDKNFGLSDNPTPLEKRCAEKAKSDFIGAFSIEPNMHAAINEELEAHNRILVAPEKLPTTVSEIVPSHGDSSMLAAHFDTDNSTVSKAEGDNAEETYQTAMNFMGELQGSVSRQYQQREAGGELYDNFKLPLNYLGRLGGSIRWLTSINNKADLAPKLDEIVQLRAFAESYHDHFKPNA